MSLLNGLTDVQTSLSSSTLAGLGSVASSASSGVQSCTEGSFATKLSALGYSGDQISDILSKTPAYDASSLEEGLSSDMLGTKANNMKQVEATANAAKVDDVRKQQLYSINTHETQEAKTSVSLTESQFGGAFNKGGKVVNQPQADYSTLEDHPESYGDINPAKMWYKINMKQLTAEFVHPSGTALKVDRYGNVTIDVAGSLKFIVAGDCSTEIRGSDDRVIRHNKNELILGDNSQQVSGESKVQVVGDLTMLASNINEN